MPDEDKPDLASAQFGAGGTVNTQMNELTGRIIQFT